MASLHPDHELITSRQAGLVEAFNKADIEGMLSYYADEGLDFSDYGLYFPVFTFTLLTHF